jgi:nucleotide-binding universal stress UspA family protein
MSDVYRVRCILVPVDGSEFSRHAAEHATRIAKTHGAEVIFLHVVDNQVVQALAQHESDGEARARERLFETGRVYLQDVTRLADEHAVAHRQDIEEGDPCTVICDTAARANADLIVMGRIGRRGARRILVGSITLRVIECCDRAVLVVTGPPPSVDPE